MLLPITLLSARRAEIYSDDYLGALFRVDAFYRKCRRAAVSRARSSQALGDTRKMPMPCWPRRRRQKRHAAPAYQALQCHGAEPATARRGPPISYD